jgi:hypothetical protein
MYNKKNKIMPQITATNRFTEESIDVNIFVHDIKFSGYGHKKVTFRVYHPDHKFEKPYTFSVTSTDMELFDNASEMNYDEGMQLIVDTLVGNDFDRELEIGDWIAEVNEKHEEEAEAE